MVRVDTGAQLRLPAWWFLKKGGGRGHVGWTGLRLDSVVILKRHRGLDALTGFYLFDIVSIL